jgi:uncharacterized protein (TIGR02118 family)
MRVVLVSEARLAVVDGVGRWTEHEPLDDGPWVTIADTVDVDGLPLTEARQAWLVEPNLAWDYERTWPLGDASPGVKRISFVRRAAALDHDQFARHWAEVHTPIARRHHPTLWRYCQNVVRSVLVDEVGDAALTDGVSELSFRSREDMTERMYDSEEGRQIAAADIASFLDAPAGWRVLARERVVADR